MIALRSLFLVLATVSTCVAADPRGFFVTVGGGVTSVEIGDYSASGYYLSNNVSEVLTLTDSSDRVSTLQIGGGYRWDSHWAVQLQYTRLGTAEAAMTLPRFPGIVSINPLPWYERNVLRYRSERLALIPSYSIPLGASFDVRIGAGVTRTQTSSYSEVTFKEWNPQEQRTVESTSRKANDWSYIATFGVEYRLGEHWSLSASGDYAPFRTKVVAPYIPTGRTVPSKDTVKADAWGATLSLAWRL